MFSCNIYIYIHIYIYLYLHTQHVHHRNHTWVVSCGDLALRTWYRCMTCMGIHSCIQTYEQTDKQKPIHTYIHIARYQKKRLNTDSDAQSRPGHVELPRHTSQTTSNDIKRHIHEATLLWCQNSQTNRCSYFFHASHLHHRKRAGKPYTNCNRCAGQLYVKLMCRI